MKITNRKVNYEYKLTGDRVEAGISLLGAEAKSLREGRGDISQATARILNGEAFLINANIPATGVANYNSTRTRKLLLHGNEILSLGTKMKQQKLSLVPTSVYTKRGLRPGGRKGRLIKVQLALGKPKRKFEKKESIKRKDIEREIAEQFKNSV